ncbi:hypothetical protein ACS0TY_021324 [Phlomoides rotata]
MSTEMDRKELGVDEEKVLHIEEDSTHGSNRSTLCLNGKVQTNKSFNVFGFLETMKRAMNPSMGFTAKEIVTHHSGSAYIYDLPMAIRTPKNVSLIATRCGEVLEIDINSMDGISRSVRVKVRVDLHKPLKKGMKLELKKDNTIWVDFKYECLPSFCYYCGLLGHMKRECDLADGVESVSSIPNDKLPYGEWLKASSNKKISVSTEEKTRQKDHTLLRRKLFEKFRQSVEEEDSRGSASTE